ncbi:MAG: phosphate acyltransferase PlsX [Phycisphaerales bacterium]|nr:phosphate acyltransferase PlsX [Phycisphaerales bacterium]
MFCAPGVIAGAVGSRGGDAGGLFAAAIRRQEERHNALLARTAGNENPYDLHQQLGDLMTRTATVVRRNEQLVAAYDEVCTLEERWRRCAISDTGNWTNQNVVFTKSLGDMFPLAKLILKGALQAVPKVSADDRVVLVGDRAVIDDMLAERGFRDPRVEVVHASEIIGMDEPPVEAVRLKRDSSINICAKISGPKEPNRCDAWISAGNTGACVAAAQMFMRRLDNVHRPGIAVTVPTCAGPVVLIDVGANIEPKPHHLAQYGVMGDVYARRILGIENPRVALMNVGGEEAKGTAEMKEARDLLRRAEDLNFTGYVEGRGVFNGDADVVITDGVVGNVMLKLAEGLSSGIFKALAREVFEIDPALAGRLDPVVKSLYAKHDYHEYGGAPLLGVNGVCLISHGSSVGRTITNAIRRARNFVELGINDAIVRRLEAAQFAEA